MVSGGGKAWEAYECWNQAILEVVFPELDSPEPVYMDFEDEVLDELGVRMAIRPSEVEKALCSAVAGTLGSGGPADIFAPHTARAARWQRSKRTDPPPFLALLAVFCIAAERISAADGMSSANYFGRLREVLGYLESDTKLDTAYRRVTEKLWGALNSWLVELDGRRGLPTAYALTFRFVGLPVSQALVRKSDRDKLNEFFRRYGFAPGADVPPSELEQVLNAWLSERPCPVSASLENLWKRGEARARICQVAAVALASWDGSVAHSPRGDGTQTGHLVLSLEVGGFPTKRFALQALLYLPQATVPREGSILTTTPESTVELVPDAQGALGLGRSSSLYPEDVLEGVLQIRDSLTGVTVERRPRRLALFRQDEITRRWVESPQVLLGETVTLVAHEDLVQRLERVLEHVARPGWQVKHAAYNGQPAHWVVVSDVEVFNNPGELVKASGMDDLSPLVPLTTSQLKIAGGFALPGQMRGKWHSRRPPEIRGISDVDGGFEVRLVDMVHWGDEYDHDRPQETLLDTWSDDGSGVVIAPLDDLELEDGDYRVEMLAASSGEMLTATTVRLRSGDSPDTRQWAAADSITHHPAVGLGSLGVQSQGGPAINGLVVSGSTQMRSESTLVPESPWWRTGRSSSSGRQTKTVRLTMPDPDSCIYTGRHREQVDTVPTDSRGKALVAWSYGRCEGCGLVRRYPTRLRTSSFGGTRKPHAAVGPVHDLGALPSVRSDELMDWGTALDALMHTGGGSWSQLERIALQLQPTALFVDQFARALEALGHIDVRRSSETLQPRSWEVTPTAIAQTEDGSLFSGYWPDALYHRVAMAVWEVGGEVMKQEQDEGPVSYFAAADTETIRQAVKSVAVDVAVTGLAWEHLASSLLPLSQVVDALPRSDASVSGVIKWFSPWQNEWIEAGDVAAVGGYRVTRFATLDFIRTKSDVSRGTIAHSTVQLSKHIAALLLKRPMVSYDAGVRELAVPLGADLPGLYGRAVVAASGMLPTADLQNRLLVYHNVPQRLARHLYYLFSN
jgi:hypothetical protein